MSPCFTPFSTDIGSESVPLKWTLAFVPSCRERTKAIHFSGQCSFNKTFQKVDLAVGPAISTSRGSKHCEDPEDRVCEQLRNQSYASVSNASVAKYPCIYPSVKTMCCQWLDLTRYKVVEAEFPIPCEPRQLQTKESFPTLAFRSTRRMILSSLGILSIDCLKSEYNDSMCASE